MVPADFGYVEKDEKHHTTLGLPVALRNTECRNISGISLMQEMISFPAIESGSHSVIPPTKGLALSHIYIAC